MQNISLLFPTSHISVHKILLENVPRNLFHCLSPRRTAATFTCVAPSPPCPVLDRAFPLSGRTQLWRCRRRVRDMGHSGCSKASPAVCTVNRQPCLMHYYAKSVSLTFYQRTLFPECGNERKKRECGHVHTATREDALRPGDQGRRRQPRDASPVAPRTRSIKGSQGWTKPYKVRSTLWFLGTWQAPHRSHVPWRELAHTTGQQGRPRSHVRTQRLGHVVA